MSSAEEAVRIEIAVSRRVLAGLAGAGLAALIAVGVAMAAGAANARASEPPLQSGGPGALPTPPALPTAPALPTPPAGQTLPSIPPVPTLPALPSVPPLPSLPPLQPGSPGPDPGAAPDPAAGALPEQPEPAPVSGFRPGPLQAPVRTAAHPSGGIGSAETLPGPLTFLPAGPVGAVLEIGLSLLPLVVALWLLVALRTVNEARRMRGQALRMALASELGVRPHDLVGMSTDSLLKLRDQVTFDELTGVMRRIAGVAAVEREIHRARRSHSPLAVAFVDVDGLKKTNDEKGHAAGDRLLKTVAGALSDRLRGHDLVFRYGGDEFVCVLPDCSAEDAQQNLLGIQETAAREGFSFSFGVAELRPQDDIVTLLGRADGVLYEGRRRRSAASRGEFSPIRLRPRSRPGPSPRRPAAV